MKQIKNIFSKINEIKRKYSITDVNIVKIATDLYKEAYMFKTSDSVNNFLRHTPKKVDADDIYHFVNALEYAIKKKFSKVPQTKCELDKTPKAKLDELDKRIDEYRNDIKELRVLIDNPYYCLNPDDERMIRKNLDVYMEIKHRHFAILFACLFITDNGKSLLRQKISELTPLIPIFDDKDKNEISSELISILLPNTLRCISTYQKIPFFAGNSIAFISDDIDISSYVRENYDHWDIVYFELNMHYYVTLDTNDWIMLLSIALIDLSDQRRNELSEYVDNLIKTEFNIVASKDYYETWQELLQDYMFTAGADNSYMEMRLEELNNE